MRSYFTVRRARVRPEYAWLYPEITPGVWIPASKAALWVSQADAGKRGQDSSDRARVMCDAHFEFRGGNRRPEIEFP